MSLVEFGAYAPLTLLLRSDGRIQRIVMNSIWRQLVFKVVVKGVSKDMTHYLNEF